jgi:hypothetical protein
MDHCEDLVCSHWWYVQGAFAEDHQLGLFPE